MFHLNVFGQIFSSRMFFLVKMLQVNCFWPNVFQSTVFQLIVFGQMFFGLMFFGQMFFFQCFGQMFFGQMLFGQIIFWPKYLEPILHIPAWMIWIRECFKYPTFITMNKWNVLLLITVKKRTWCQIQLIYYPRVLGNTMK